MSRISGYGRLPDTSMQVGRLPDTSMQVGRLPTVENVAGGLGRMGSLGAAITPKQATNAMIEAGRKRALAIQKRLPPGTNIMRGVAQASAQAQKAAAQAKALKDKAIKAIKANDRRTAGIAAVQALQATRKAAELGNSAAKTKAVLAKEAQAAQLEKSAATITAQAQAQANMTGENGGTMARRAQAQAMAKQAEKLRGEAAVIAVRRPPLWMLPSNERIAEVAAQFDVRTRRVQAISREDDALLLATLQGLESDQAGGSVYSEMNAAAAYGVDGVGRLMGAAERGDVPLFVSTLQGLSNLGAFWNTLPEGSYCPVAYSKGEDKGWLGRREQNLTCYTEWCNRVVRPKSEDEFKKCATESYLGEPWNTVGAAARGMNVDWLAAVMDTGKAVMSGQPKPSDSTLISRTTTTFAPDASGRLAPTGQSTSYGPGYRPPAPPTGMSLGAKIGIGVGVAAVVGGAAWFMLRK